MNAKEIAHQLFQEIRSDIAKGDIPRVGICVAFLDKYDNVPTDIKSKAENPYGIMKRLMVEWPKTSGSYWYPVHFDKTVTAEREFIESEKAGTLYSGEYGALRIELLDYMIENTK